MSLPDKEALGSEVAVTVRCVWRARTSVYSLKGLLSRLSSSALASCYFHPVHSASVIDSRFHHLSYQVCDTTHFLASNLFHCLTPLTPVTQTIVSPPDTVSHLHAFHLKLARICPSSVSPLSYRSLYPWSPAEPLSLICHVCYVASILHVTISKQTILPFLSSPWALFLPPGLSIFSPVLLYICLIRFPNPLSPIGPTSGPAQIMSVTPNKAPLQVDHLPLNCRTCYFFLLSPLSLSAAWCSASDGCAIVSESAVLNIKPRAQTDTSSSTESVYLGVTAISSAASPPSLTSPRPLQPFYCVNNSCLSTEKWQLHFAMCYSSPYNLKRIPLQIAALPKNSPPFSGFSPGSISDSPCVPLCGRHFVFLTRCCYKQQPESCQ